MWQFKDCFELEQNKVVWCPLFRRELEDWMAVWCPLFHDGPSESGLCQVLVMTKEFGNPIYLGNLVLNPFVESS